MRNRFFALSAAVLLVSRVAMADPADLHVTQLDTTQYGHYDQNNAETLLGNVACGPTSVANSFKFLEQKYGLSGLIDPNDPYTTINELETYMNTSSPNGTTIGDLINGKKQYISDMGLSDKISVEGQTFFNLGINGVTDNTKPTWNFLFDQIDKGQDVEVLINWWTGTKYSGGHYLTITGMSWDEDLNTGTISFIDPWGGVDLTGTLAYHNGFMQVTYGGGAAVDPRDPDNPDHVSSADISGVVAESPVPEPATIGIIAGAFLLGNLRRSRRDA
jgi:hypothetical protein